MEQEDNKRQRKQKIMVRYDNWLFDLYELKRIETFENYNKEFHDGMSYSIRLYFFTYPSEKVFDYETEELRKIKVKELEAKMSDNGIILI